MNINVQQLKLHLLPNETASDLLKRAVREVFITGLRLIDCSVPVRAGQIVELAGSPQSCKTEILIQIAVNTLLKHLSSRESGNSPAAGNVVLIDLDGKFEPLRLLQVLNWRIQGWIQELYQTQDAGTSILQSCLEHFHLVKCHNSQEYLACLLALPKLLSTWQAGAPNVLLVDNIAANYWLEQSVQRGVPGGPVGGAWGMGESPLSWRKVHSTAAEILQCLANKYRLLVVCSKNATVDWQQCHNPALPPGTHSTPELVAKEQMPPTWQDVVHHRFTLKKETALTAHAARATLGPAASHTGHRAVAVQYQEGSSSSHGPARVHWIEVGEGGLMELQQ